jgi:diacylglycerol kinase family enzyme
MAKKYLLLANPTARSGQAKQRIDLVQREMARRAMTVEFMATEAHGRTVEKLSRYLSSNHADVVIAMGGDGTFAEIGKGILAAQSKALMGLIPSGTANDQGRSFGISPRDEDLDQTLTTIQREFVVELDVGKIQALKSGEVVAHNLFFDSVGFGMQPDILASRNRDRQAVSKIPLLREVYKDEAVYIGAVLGEYVRSWMEPTKFDATVRTKDQHREFWGLTDLIINNTAVYAAAWVPAPHGEPNDGLFELCPMVGRRDMFSKMIRDLHAFPIWQEHLDALGLKHSEGLSASKFELSFRRSSPLRSQIDGEEWVAGMDFQINVLAQALPLIIPQNFTPPWKQKLF